MSQLRKIRYRLFSWKKFPILEPSKDPIDVVIPIIAKDLHILPLCLEGIRHCVVHPVQAIYIVAPVQEEIIRFCETHHLQFVDEKSIFGFSPKELNIQYVNENGNVRDRSGWLFQQLVKLSGKVGTCRYYLCIDADHVLIHSHVFLTKEYKTVFYMSYEEHQPYYDNIQHLLPGLPLDTLSYVDHKMLFDKEQIEALHQALGGEQWIKTILDNYDSHSHAGFSEFELYGNFVQDKVKRPWLQKTLRYNKLADYERLCEKWKKSRWSLTFPDYMNK